MPEAVSLGRMLTNIAIHGVFTHIQLSQKELARVGRWD
jgi:hypothetical protein